jgi:FdhD protein
MPETTCATTTGAAPPGATPTAEPAATPADRARAVEAWRATAAAVEAPQDELVAIEEPLEIRLAGEPLAVVMRTPGDDEELVRGFLLTEGIVLTPAEIAAVEPWAPESAGEPWAPVVESERPPLEADAAATLPGARLSVQLAPGVAADPAQFQRQMFVSSSCGVCGKASIEAVQLFAPRPRPFTLRRALLATLVERLRERQPTFEATGGLHAAGVFDAEGALLAAHEDVGRHNAVDKAIGAASRVRWPLGPTALVVSGRQSFEIVQKAAMAGIGAVIGVSAPSSLAVELASELGMLLAGFAREGRFTVYAGPERLRK